MAAQIADFVKYPPRQKPASFNLDTVMHKLTQAQEAVHTGTQAAPKAESGGQQGLGKTRPAESALAND